MFFTFRFARSYSQPVAQDTNLRRITVSNDDGDVYVESSGDGSEIVLKTEKVRVDGDVYCEGSQVGLSARLDAVFPPKCVRPGGDKLQYDGSEWLCICNGAFGGETCETTWTPEARVVNTSESSGGWYSDEQAHLIAADGDEILIGGGQRRPMILKRVESATGAFAWEAVWNFSSKYIWVENTKYDTTSFGASVALEGDLALVGAPQQSICLREYNDANNGYSYCDRSVNGPGFALIFARVGTSDEWQLEANLTASDAPTYVQYWNSNENNTNYAYVRFGTDVALSGDYAIVTSRRTHYGYQETYGGDHVERIVPGAAYVFKRQGANQWIQQAKLVSDLGNATNNDDYMYYYEGDDFGRSVDLSGDVAVVSAHADYEKGYRAGAAYVFTRAEDNGSEVWQRTAKLTASDASPHDQFGFVVSVSGDYIFIGAPQDDENGSESGSVYVFTRVTSSSAWIQVAKLTASNAAPNDRFGYSVSVKGARALIGAPWKASAFGGAGVVYVYEQDQNSDEWQEALVKLTDFAGLKSQFGERVSLSNDYAVGGVFLRDYYMGGESDDFVIVISNVSSIP